MRWNSAGRQAKDVQTHGCQSGQRPQTQGGENKQAQSWEDHPAQGWQETPLTAILNEAPARAGAFPVSRRTLFDKRMDEAGRVEYSYFVAKTTIFLFVESVTTSAAMPQGDIIGFAPLLCLTKAEADVIVEATRRAIARVATNI